MKKVVHINLGGYPVTIDEDACLHLEQYLQAVDRSFRHLEGHDEILQDIELRFAELLEQQRKSRPIATMGDVVAVIAILGRPEDFQEEPAGTPGGEARQEDAAREEPAYAFRPGKKLYRDPEDKVIGGVCSGLAAYLGIADPIWIRLGFLLLFFTGGFGLLTYLILLVLVPKATTAADRLAMRGEQVNINTIAQAVEKQFEDISARLNELGKDFRRKR